MRKNNRHSLSIDTRLNRPVLPAKLKARSVRSLQRPAPLRTKVPVMSIVGSGPEPGPIPDPRIITAMAKPVVGALQSITPAAGKKGRLLWIGDAVVPTGFGTVTHSVLEHLAADWDVVVSGINYDGSPHLHSYTIIPAWQGGDMWGKDRFADVCAEFAPDAVIINNDWWNVADFVKQAPKGLPVIAYMPVDGANLNPGVVPWLNKLAAAVWYTEFGYQQAVSAGFKGARHVIPHGLNDRQFSPVNRALSRKLLELPVPEGAFIVGNVNRNQPRKRLDLTLQYFAAWVKQGNVKDAFLLLHCARKDAGWDLESVARYYGIADRVLFTGTDDLRNAVGLSSMQLVYSSMDVQVSTTLGEGWGLTTMEGMACGIPQVVPDWAALGEWATPAQKVPCSTTIVHPEINTVGAIPDKAAFIATLDRLYRNPAQRNQLAEEGTAFVRQKRFCWSSVAKQMEEVVEGARPVKPRRKG